MKYGQYLKKNYLWIYLAFVAVATMFSLYWIAFQKNYIGDLIITWLLVGVIGVVFLIGNWISYKKL